MGRVLCVSRRSSNRGDFSTLRVSAYLTLIIMPTAFRCAGIGIRNTYNSPTFDRMRHLYTSQNRSTYEGGMVSSSSSEI
eukprot:scaffold262369_cov33-Tisochrysis_lutea.AAC.5